MSAEMSVLWPGELMYLVRCTAAAVKLCTVVDTKCEPYKFAAS